MVNYHLGSKMNRRAFIKAASVGGTVALLPARVGISASVDYPNLNELRISHQKKGIIPPNKTYRMMEWEFHTPPQGEFNINVEAAIQAARDAGSESLMVYSQDQWGYAYYLSDTAVRHPHLTGDLFGKEVSLARGAGMSVVCYYCLQINNQCALSHPDWGWVNEHGEQQRYRSWYFTCLDTPYRQYVLRMMDEIFSRYEIDELFLDSFGIQFAFYHGGGRNPFCFCKYTEDAWNKEHPGDPYREGFKSREGWELRYQWHQKRTMTEMLDEVIKIARKYRPNLLVSLNGGPESFPADIMEKVSFIYAEPISTSTGISIGSILMRGWGRPYYQAGIFTQYGYLDTYPGSLSRVQANARAVQNARTFIVGNAPVLSGLDGQGFSQRWFSVAKETWADLSQVDCLLGPEIEPVYSTAMLYSLSTRKKLDSQNRPVDFRHSTKGALETLTYAGRPVESLAEFRLTPETLSQFEVLVLPEVEVLSDAQVATIRRWVEGGGTIIASYKCGLLDENIRMRSNFPLADVFGVDYVSEERTYAYDEEGRLRSSLGEAKDNPSTTYLESVGHPLAKMLDSGTVGLPGSFLYLKKTTAQEVMRYRLPFMVQDLAHNQWFNWGPPPPGEKPGGTAVAYNKFGEGQSLYMGVPIFWAMQGQPNWIREWIPALLQQLVPKPIAEIRPEPKSKYVHGTFFYDKSKRFILVQVLNAMELATQGEFRPVSNVELRINSTKLKVNGARVLWPKEEDLTVINSEGFTRIVLPNPERYMVLYLRLA